MINHINHAQVANLGVIAVKLSSGCSRLGVAVEKLFNSTTLQFSDENHESRLQSFSLRVAAQRGGEECLGFLRRCKTFWPVVATSSFEAYPAFSHVRASNDLKESVMRLTQDANVVEEDTAPVQGLSMFQPTMHTTPL